MAVRCCFMLGAIALGHETAQLTTIDNQDWQTSRHIANHTEKRDGTVKQINMDNRWLRPGRLLIGLIVFDMAVITIAVVLGIHAGDPLEHFREKRLTTWISFFQLVAVSWAAYSTYTVRNPDAHRFNWSDRHAIWAIIAFGIPLSGC